MKTLFVSLESFTEMLSGLIASGVTFESKEENGGMIKKRIERTEKRQSNYFKNIETISRQVLFIQRLKARNKRKYQQSVGVRENQRKAAK